MLTLECIFVPRNSLHLLHLTFKYWDLFRHLLCFTCKYRVILYTMLISICTVLCVCMCVCVHHCWLSRLLGFCRLTWAETEAPQRRRERFQRKKAPIQWLNFFLLVATFQPDDVFAEVFSSLSVCEWLFELKICKDLSYKHVTHLATVQE